MVVVGAARVVVEDGERLRDALGLGVGDRVAILAPNCPTYLAMFFACSKSGWSARRSTSG